MPPTIYSLSMITCAFFIFSSIPKRFALKTRAEFQILLCSSLFPQIPVSNRCRLCRRQPNRLLCRSCGIRCNNNLILSKTAKIAISFLPLYLTFFPILDTINVTLQGTLIPDVPFSASPGSSHVQTTARKEAPPCSIPATATTTVPILTMT